MAKIEPSPTARALKALRERAGISVRQAAKLVGREGGGYQHYEDKFKGQWLPADIVRALVPEFEQRGINPEELWKLAGFPIALSVSSTTAINNPSSSSGGTMTADEAELVSLYRQLEQGGKVSLMDRAKVLLLDQREARPMSGRRPA
jgi:hypothetical protein